LTPGDPAPAAAGSPATVAPSQACSPPSPPDWCTCGLASLLLPEGGGEPLEEVLLLLLCALLVSREPPGSSSTVGGLPRTAWPPAVPPCCSPTCGVSCPLCPSHCCECSCASDLLSRKVAWLAVCDPGGAACEAGRLGSSNRTRASGFQINEELCSLWVDSKAAGAEGTAGALGSGGAGASTVPCASGESLCRRLPAMLERVCCDW
jgi:hypothetical protein